MALIYFSTNNAINMQDSIVVTNSEGRSFLLEPPMIEVVHTLVESNRKVLAIKMIRYLVGVIGINFQLREAKHFVDFIFANYTKLPSRMDDQLQNAQPQKAQKEPTLGDILEAAMEEHRKLKAAMQGKAR